MVKFISNPARFFLLVCFLTHGIDSGAGIPPEEKTTPLSNEEIIQKVKDRIIGQDPSIEELVPAIQKFGSRTLIFGPEGVGKYTLLETVAEAATLKLGDIDVRTIPATEKGLYSAIATQALSGADVIVIHYAESMNLALQTALYKFFLQPILALPSTANDSKSKESKNSAPTKTEKEFLDLSEKRIVLITSNTDHIFRNPVGFRNAAVLEPDTDEFLKSLTDDRVKRFVSEYVLLKPVADLMTDFVPVRRLNFKEFQEAISLSLQNALSNLAVNYGKDFQIDRLHDFAFKLANDHFRVAKSTYHHINELVGSVFEIPDDKMHLLESKEGPKAVLLNWHEDQKGFHPVALDCDQIAKGKNSPH